MSLRTLQMIFAFGALMMSFIFFIKLILITPYGTELWTYFILYWIVGFTANVLFYIRTETEPRFRRFVNGTEE